MGILNLANKIRGGKTKKYIFDDKIKSISNFKLTALLPVRNEELILNDTLEYLSSFADAIIAYDDASTDNTFRILKKYSKCIAIIRNFKWSSDPNDRLLSETKRRSELLELAKQYNPQWILCTDADERIIGNLKEFIASEKAKNIDVVRISLFDAYITKNDFNGFKKGDKLLNFREYFGPERRDIVMLWKN